MFLFRLLLFLELLVKVFLVVAICYCLLVVHFDVIDLMRKGTLQCPQPLDQTTAGTAPYPTPYQFLTSLQLRASVISSRIIMSSPDTHPCQQLIIHILPPVIDSLPVIDSFPVIPL